MSKPKSLSGIQPSGALHIGNYVGAIKQWVELQDQYESYYCIVDLHAITVPYQPSLLRQKIIDTAVDYIACGLNPDKTAIFVQSHLPNHAELAWLLNTITPISELGRMTQFKEKSYQHAKHINAGLFNYPVLMAADILLYKPAIVPVGEDQKQHVELTRQLAKKFNATFGETFSLPEVRLNQGARIMSLADPSKKMSKSLGPAHYIALSDDEMTIRKKIGRAVTDTGPSNSTLAKEEQRGVSPGVKNLFTLLEFFADKKTYDHLRAEQAEGKLRYAALKPILADAIIETLKPMQTKRAELLARPEKIEKILKEGAERAHKVASITLKEVKEKMGLL